MQSATDLLRSHYAAQHTPEQKQTTRQYTLYAACLGLHPAQTRGRVRAGRPAGQERGGGERDANVTLRLEVWQLRHDWVVLLRRRLRWSMSMEKSRSSRSPFMTCVCADSANMAGTDGAGGGGAAATTTTTTATRRTRGGSVLAQGTE